MNPWALKSYRNAYKRVWRNRRLVQKRYDAYLRAQDAYTRAVINERDARSEMIEIERNCQRAGSMVGL